MKPKNSKERRNSFLKFLLLFVVTVVTIVSAVFFNFQIADRENEALKKQAIRVEDEIKFQGKFSNEMNQISIMIDSLTQPGASIAFENTEIGRKLSELQNLIPIKDSTYNYEFYFNVIKVLSTQQKSQNRLLDLKETEEKINKLETIIKDCDEQVKDLERELQIALRSSN